MHPYAVRMHDAVKIAGKAWLAWKSKKDNSPKAWPLAHIGLVEGAAGDLKLLEGYIMAGPIGLVSGQPDGKIRFKRTPVTW